jgi:hypothetical protein
MASMLQEVRRPLSISPFTNPQLLQRDGQAISMQKNSGERGAAECTSSS